MSLSRGRSIEATIQAIRESHPRFIAFAVVVATLVAYAPGLAGPYLFDDSSNIITPMLAVLEGHTGWAEFLRGNRSGILGRPVSMLSFALNGVTTGLEVVPFKATNLAIHLLCGAAVFLLLRRLLRCDPVLNTKAAIAATLITAVWLLHPMQVSTVLYTVQRMAQLSALFVLMALLCYLVGRDALQTGRQRAAYLNLFLLFPLCTALAALSKENGVLAPLLCAVIEVTYFSRLTLRPGDRNVPRWPVRAFFGVFLILPALAAIALLALRPARFLSGYEGRLFTLTERLLTQPHALLDYVAALLWPRGAALGVYTDDFPISHGLIDPPITLLAVILLATWMLASVLLRKRIPAFFAGTWFFFCAHAMESTIFPLEIYFEHRNYLPSVGLFLAVAGIVGWCLARFEIELAETRVRRLLTGGGIAIVMMLGVATTVRSNVWSTWASIAEQGAQQHPTSRRAHLDKLSILLTVGQVQEAREVLDQMLDFPDPAAYSSAALTHVWLDCREDGRVNSVNRARLSTLVGRKLQLAELFPSEKIGAMLLETPCEGLTADEFASWLRDLTNEAGQNPAHTQVWRLRFQASRLFASTGQLPLAIEQSALAWMTGKADPAVGVFLINLYLAADDRRSAEILLPQVRASIAGWDSRNHKQLEGILSHFGMVEE